MLDLRGVVFMNSSGIRWLGMPVLAARRQGVAMTVRGDAAVPWLAKSLPGLSALHAELAVELR